MNPPYRNYFENTLTYSFIRLLKHIYEIFIHANIRYTKVIFNKDPKVDDRDVIFFQISRANSLDALNSYIRHFRSKYAR